jgi:hypothetical protein
VRVFRFVVASWILVNPQRAVGFLAAALYYIDFFVVGALLYGDLDVHFLGCSEPSAAFVVEEPVKEVVEAFG